MQIRILWILLQRSFRHVLNDRIGDEFKNDKTDSNFARKFSSLPRKHGRGNHGKN